LTQQQYKWRITNHSFLDDTYSPFLYECRIFMCYVRYLKSFLIISAVLSTNFAFVQANTAHTFSLLRLKDGAKLTYATKSKEFHKALSFRDSTTQRAQTNKRPNWIVSVGRSYYGWEGFAHYNNEVDTIELWKANSQDVVLLSYTTFVDLNNDKGLDIIFSNIYDQFLKTQSNWTDIYIHSKGKYIPIALNGYLISLEKKKNNILRLRTVEQPVAKTDEFFTVHSYEVDMTSNTAKETTAERVNRQTVRQHE